jgi:hypothetical protein
MTEAVVERKSVECPGSEFLNSYSLLTSLSSVVIKVEK